MNKLYKACLAVALGLFSMQAHSLVISAGSCPTASPDNYSGYFPQTYTTVTSVDYTCWQNQPKKLADGTTNNPGYISNPDVSDFATITGLTLSGLTEYYKQDVGGPESGLLQSSYKTTFNGDLSGGTIENDGNNFMSCPSCYLLVKDGATTPSWYLFDIGFWDGMDTIEMSGFWPSTGAISHVSLWGTDYVVPEPGMVGLLAIGLLGMVAARRKARL